LTTYYDSFWLGMRNDSTTQMLVKEHVEYRLPIIHSIASVTAKIQNFMNRKLKIKFFIIGQSNRAVTLQLCDCLI